MIKKVELKESGKFPITFDYLISLYENSSEYLKHSILNSIISLEDDRIKHFGYILLEDINLFMYGLEMIIKFYDKTDRDILLKYVPKVPVTYDDKYDWHSLYREILNLIDEKTSSAPLELLTFMYENSLCSYCRESYLIRMKKNHLLPKYVIEECLYDSNSDIIKFAKRLFK